MRFRSTYRAPTIIWFLDTSKSSCENDVTFPSANRFDVCCRSENEKKKKRESIKSIGKLEWALYHLYHMSALVIAHSRVDRRSSKLMETLCKKNGCRAKVCHSSRRRSGQHLTNQVNQWRLNSHIDHDHYLGMCIAHAYATLTHSTQLNGNYLIIFLENDRRVAESRFRT